MGTQQVAAIVTLLVAAAAIALGGALRRVGRGRSERGFRLACVFVAIPAWLFMQGWYAFAQPFDPIDDAPLHICDLGGVIAMAALGLRWRWWRAVLFFWGFGLTSIAFVTPVLTDEQGPRTMVFWLFWVSHGWVVGAAAYDLVVLGYRPTPRDLARALTVTAAWFALVVTLNNVNDPPWNYGYTGPTDDPDRQPGLVRLMGPYPWRLLPMAGIVVAVFTLLWGIAKTLPRIRSDPV